VPLTGAAGTVQRLWRWL